MTSSSSITKPALIGAVCERIAIIAATIVTALSLFVPTSMSKEIAVNVPFEISATINYESGHELELTLSNTSTEPLQFYPWVLSRDAFTLVVSHDSPNANILEEFVPMENPTVGELILAPNAKKQFSYDLEKAFPSLLSELKKRPLILFWATHIRTMDAHKISKRFGGYLVIPQQN